MKKAQKDLLYDVPDTEVGSNFLQSVVERCMEPVGSTWLNNNRPSSNILDAANHLYSWRGRSKVALAACYIQLRGPYIRTPSRKLEKMRGDQDKPRGSLNMDQVMQNLSDFAERPITECRRRAGLM